jgi:16S rRNA (uracil1498-N3)-methyltransferase
MERMQSILVSAMLQSQQCWLPGLQEPVKYANMQMDKYANMQKMIAHCENIENKQPLTNKLINESTPEMIGTFRNKPILIGPEGDFSAKEIELALQHNFIPVSLGITRLRTETAGVVAATFLANS